MSFKTKLLAGVALAAVCTAPALAADLSGIPYAGANWAGPYAGFALGVANTNATVSASAGWASASISGSDSQTSANFIAGYNWQAGNVVYGIEADIDAVSDWNYLASIRGRYGMLYGNWLVYGTAGIGFVIPAARFRDTVSTGMAIAQQAWSSAAVPRQSSATIGSPVPKLCIIGSRTTARMLATA